MPPMPPSIHNEHSPLIGCGHGPRGGDRDDAAAEAGARRARLQLAGPSRSDVEGGGKEGDAFSDDADRRAPPSSSSGGGGAAGGARKAGGRDDDLASTLASVVGNILEWYDFAIYGYFSDVIGRQFFPSSNSEATSIIESFLVFGGAFFARPIGGVLMGYVGDKFSRKRALELSIFLMAVPTFLMGCLPTFERVGWWAVAMLLAVRLLQGLSAGGQLMSSLVFVAEGHERRWWGWYGSLAMTAANSGTLLGGICGFGMRHYFTQEQLEDGLWRVPFLCGVLVSASGFYLKHHVKDHERIEPAASGLPTDGGRRRSPLEIALSKEMRGSLFSVTAAVSLWAGGFYIVFVWLVIFMRDLIERPVEMPFAINALSLFVTVVAAFPFAGWLSDAYGRRPVMTIGASGVAVLAPAMMRVVGRGDSLAALAAQTTLGACLCLYGAPLCAFLVESFPPESRLTSVAVGYNTAMAIAGGLSPAFSTQIVLVYGPEGAGYLLSAFAVISLCGVHMTPRHDYKC